VTGRPGHGADDPADDRRRLPRSNRSPARATGLGGRQLSVGQHHAGQQIIIAWTRNDQRIDRPLLPEPPPSGR
jgi:hypothetical protein